MDASKSMWDGQRKMFDGMKGSVSCVKIIC